MFSTSRRKSLWNCGRKAQGSLWEKEEHGMELEIGLRIGSRSDPDGQYNY
jgi:hypothetical protein